MDNDLSQLIAVIREREALLPADAVTIITPAGDFQCHAALRLTSTEFNVEISIPSGPTPEPLEQWQRSLKQGVGSMGKEDFWTVVGQLPELGPFTAIDVLPPMASTEQLGYWRSSLKFDRLQLCPHPLTEEQQKEQEEWWRGVMTRFGRSPSETSDDELVESSVRMCARIIGQKSPFLNEGTKTTQTNPFLGEIRSEKTDTLVGESSVGTFALIQSGSDLDVHLQFRRLSGSSSQSKDDERKFNSLLQAVGLSHGFNPLPCYFELQQNTHTINRWIRPMFRANRPSLTPFWEGMCRFHSECATFVKSAFEYFLLETPKQEAIQQLLAVFHDSDHPDIPFDVRLLTVCTLVEGLVTLLLDERLRPSEGFKRVKSAVVAWAVEKNELPENQDREQWGRLVGYLKGWGYTRPEEKWRRLCELLNLPWDTQFKEIHKLWQEMRNPLSHGAHKSIDANDAERKLLAVSRIGGAFNTLIAAHIGYHGPIQISPYESKALVISG